MFEIPNLIECTLKENLTPESQKRIRWMIVYKNAPGSLDDFKALIKEPYLLKDLTIDDIESISEHEPNKLYFRLKRKTRNIS